MNFVIRFGISTIGHSKDTIWGGGGGGTQKWSPKINVHFLLSLNVPIKDSVAGPTPAPLMVNIFLQEC